MKGIVRNSLLFLILAALVCLPGCGKAASTQVEDRNGDGKLTCTLEIRCDTVLDNLEDLSPEKRDLVPADGTLLYTGEIEFTGGDTVFDILKREIVDRKLHFEYTDGSIYGAVYIEGICNLYEYDCGKQSGWMYSVNGEFPNLGCSAYTLSDGDAVQFLYTCDLGRDIGGYTGP